MEEALSGSMQDTEFNGRWPIYTRANAGEIMGDPVSPLGWSYLWSRDLLTAWVDGYVAAGVMSAEELTKGADVGGVFGGFFYVNLSNIRTYGARLSSAEAADRSLVGDRPDKPAYVPHPADSDPTAMAKAAEGMAKILAWKDVPYVDGERAQARAVRTHRPDLSTLSEAELLTRADSLRSAVRRPFMTNSVVGLMSLVPPAMFQGIYAALGQDDRSIELVAGVGDIDSVRPTAELWELSRKVRLSSTLTAAFDEGVDGVLDRLRAGGEPDAKRFVEEFEDFLVEFGSRGPAEWELAAAVWETHPILPLRHIDSLRKSDQTQSPDERNVDVRARRQELVGALRAAVAGIEGLEESAEIAIRTSGLFVVGRERAKTASIQALHEVRMTFLELGRRAQERGVLTDASHVTMLREDELHDFVHGGSDWCSTLAARWSEYRARFDVEPPFFVDSRVGISPSATPSSRTSSEVDGGGESVSVGATGEVLSGVGGSPGVATGRARIVTDPYVDSELEPGDILVAPSTDPSWTPLFYVAGAVVVAMGGINSHAVIVSRELGVPCVVSVAECTTLIPDGAEITVDGINGTVTIN